MGATSKRKGRRFPKPQVTGSNPVGVTDSGESAGSSAFLRAARARAELLGTLARAGLSRNRAAHYVRQADFAAEALAQIERDAVREALRGWR
jgi:hypothetical protein